MSRTFISETVGLSTPVFQPWDGHCEILGFLSIRESARAEERL
jgi:hypothetical protein